MRGSVNNFMFPLTFSNFSPKIAVAAGVAGVSLMLAGIFVYEVYAQPLPEAHAASVPAGTVYLSPSAQAAVTAPAADAPMLEMHVANNGLTLLRGARVLSVSGSSMQVGMSWGASTFIWNVSTAYNTEFFGTAGAKETLSDVQAGDVVTVTGTLNAGGVAPGIAATIIHE